MKLETISFFQGVSKKKAQHYLYYSFLIQEQSLDNGTKRNLKEFSCQRHVLTCVNGWKGIKNSKDVCKISSAQVCVFSNYIFKKNTCVIFSQSFVSAVFPSVNLTTFGLKILGGDVIFLQMLQYVVRSTMHVSLQTFLVIVP